MSGRRGARRAWVSAESGKTGNTLRNGRRCEVVCVTTESPVKILGALNPPISLPLPTARMAFDCKAFTTSAIPATFLLSKAGEIAFQHVGATDWAGTDAIKYIRDTAEGRANNPQPPRSHLPVHRRCSLGAGTGDE